MPIFIPPGGFVGWANQTPATQAMLGRRGASAKRRSRTKSQNARPRRKKAAARRARKAGGRFTKGSAAAKRHMAKLRRMRKR